MADVLGTVVGVISFGLQVCSGIAKYLDGIEGHRDEIASATRLCETLQGLLDDLQARRTDIATASHGNPVAIERAMASANAELGGLRAFVDEVRISDDPSKSFSEWIRDRTRRTVYPFRRPRLGRLETQLSEANKMLQTALQVVQFEISIETGNAIRSVETEVSKTRTELNTKLDYLQQASTEDHHTMEKLSDDLSQVSLSLETFVPHAQQHMEASSVQLTRVESRIEEVVSALVSSDSQIVLRRVLTKPDALRLACSKAGLDHQSSGSLYSLQTARPDVPTMNNMFSCRCNPRRMRKRTKRGFSSAFITTESHAEKVHASDCPLAGVMSQKSWSIGISTKAFRTLLSTAITVSMSSTSGAGGFSIFPSLRIYFICKQTPAFRIIRTIKQSTRLDNENFALVLQKGIQALQWMFKSGKASPLEVDIFYGNLLHAACIGSGMSSAFDMWKLKPLLAYLVAIGVPRDQPHDMTNELPLHLLFGWTAYHLDYAANLRKSSGPSSNHTGFASMALDHQFLMPDDTYVMSGDPPLPTSSNSPANIKFYHEVACALPDTTEWYGNALHIAIMQRDRVKFVEILKKDTVRATLGERDAFGYTSLQLLASWSAGIELLLCHWGPQSLRVDNYERLSMLSYALYGSKEICSVSLPARCPHTCTCADNVVKLLEADCLIQLDDRLLVSVLDAPMRCQEAVVSFLIKRREQLAYLALNKLSPTEIKDFGISEETILDTQTQEVVKALKRRNVEVPQRLQTQAMSYSRRARWSLYHQISYLRTETDTRHLLNIVHSHGFRGIDAPNPTGFTPSMIAREPLTFINLVKMGADPALQIPGAVSGFTTTHHLFGCLGGPTMEEEDFRMLIEVRENIQLSHSFPAGDKCVCECAVYGCHPYSMLCKGIVGDLPSQWAQRLDWLSYRMTPISGWDVPEDFKLIAVRMTTFESLSIHHTCCDRRGKPRDIDDEDIEELLEEDSRAIETLHELLPEFEAKLAEMSCSFSEFMRTYWKDSMVQALEELNEPQPLTEENLREIRSLGVNLKFEEEAEEDNKNEPEWGTLEYFMAELDRIMEKIDV